MYNDALRLATDAHVERLGLFHHNQERSDRAVDDIVGECKRLLEEQKNTLACEAISAGTEIVLQ